MRRGHKDFFFSGRMAKLVGALFLAGTGLLALTQLDTLRRYLGIRRMSARRHPTPPGTQRQREATMPRWGSTHWPVH
jgi:hypothetical protein